MDNSFVYGQGDDPLFWPFSTTCQPKSILAAENPFDNAFATAAPFPQTNHAAPGFSMLDSQHEPNASVFNDPFDLGVVAEQGSVEG